MTVAEKKEIDSIKAQLNAILGKIEHFGATRPMPTLIIKKEDRIRYVIDSICDFYGVDQQTLVKRYKNTKYANRKKFTIKLLKDVADISFMDIAEELGSKNSDASARFAYDNLTSDLAESSYGNKELKQEYKELLKYLGV